MVSYSRTLVLVLPGFYMSRTEEDRFNPNRCEFRGTHEMELVQRDPEVKYMPDTLQTEYYSVSFKNSIFH